MRPKLKVFANPYGLIHPVYGPQGACPQDPVEHARGLGGAPLRRWVGAELDPELTKIVEERDPTVDLRENKQVTVFRFTTETVDLPYTQFYVDRLRDGDLVPADDATRERVTCRYKDIEEAKAAAKAAFDAQHGDGAFNGLLKSLAALHARKPAAPAHTPPTTTPPTTTGQPETPPTERKAGSK